MVKGFQQAFTGNNYITGEHLSAGDRWGEGIGATLSIIPIPGLEHAGKYGTKGVIWAGSKLKNIFGEGTVKTTKKLVYECNCFTAGTKVLTDEGEKNIEDIEVGDKVLSRNEETGEQTYKEVTATFNHETDEIYQIHVGDQVIESTFNHPFYVEGKGWTFVKDLKVGDLLVQSDGNTLKIESIELEHRQATVYNMTVDEFHTYFVSDLGIWVHNTGCDLPPVLNSQMIDFAVSNTSRLQHAYKHGKDFGWTSNWNKQVGQQFGNYVSGLLSNSTKSFDNMLGQDAVKGYFSVDSNGYNMAVYIYKNGPNAGQVATVVKLGDQQMIKFGLN